MTTVREGIKRRCIVLLCKNERFDLVHKFPTDIQRAEEWRRAINLPEVNNLSIDVLRKRTICSKHFRKEDYKNVESRSLNKTAVPSLNLRKEAIVKKPNIDCVTAKCPDQPSAFVLYEDNLKKNQMLVKKNIEPTEPQKFFLSSCSIPKLANMSVKYTDQSRKKLKLKNVSEESTSPKLRIIDKTTQKELIPSLDCRRVVSSVPVVNVSGVEYSITSIGQPAQLDFLSANNADQTNHIVEIGSYETESIQHLKPTYFSMVDDSITIRDPNSSEPLTLNNVWLRDHCCCSECYNNETKQRKISFLDIPIDIKPTNYNINGNYLDITWPDNHQSSYDLAKLSSNTFEKYKASIHASYKKTLWNAKSIKSLPYARVSFHEYLCDENVAKSFVSSLVEYGVAFIEKVPPNMLTTELAIKRLFNVHKTFFGEMWAFHDDKAHNDNAYTRESLSAHTDNMYFNDAAGIQALHCLTHTGQGGETLLVDGFNVLNNLKTYHEDVFQRLCTANVESEYIEDGRHHTYMAPIVKLNSLTQQPEQIRFNSHDRAPMRSIPMSEMTTFYRDMQILTKNIQSPDNEWWFKLEPGTVVFFDNWRLLHGRKSYTGNRKMGGGYVSRTEFMSVARTMTLIS